MSGKTLEELMIENALKKIAEVPDMVNKHYEEALDMAKTQEGMRQVNDHCMTTLCNMIATQFMSTIYATRNQKNELMPQRMIKESKDNMLKFLSNQLEAMEEIMHKKDEQRKNKEG